MRISAFCRSADAQAMLIRSIFAQGFPDARYNVVIQAPYAGSVKATVGVIVTLVGGTFLFFDSPMGEAFSEGAFGKEPAEITREAGQWLRKTLVPSVDRTPGDEEAVRGIIEHLVTSISQDFLICSEDTLETLIRRGAVPKDISEGYSEFYGSCLNDPDVDSVSFPKKPTGPIPRSNFAQRQALRSKVQGDVTRYRFVEEATLQVTSPNLEVDDQAHRMWKGKMRSGKECYFQIEDRQFWLQIHRREISFTHDDTITVQWSFEEGKRGGRDYRVHRVLSFNGRKLAQPLTEDALVAILGEFHDRNEYDPSGDSGPVEVQGTLFDKLDI